VGLTALAAWAFVRSRQPLAGPPFPRPPPVPSEIRDYAVSALALGEIQPPIEALADAELEAVVRVLAHLFHAYETASFGSFLALRAGDLEFAQRARAERVGELHAFLAELGVGARDAPGDWLGALGAFWTAYYAAPPIARFVPEEIHVEVHADEPPGDEADWWSAFEAMRDRRPGFVVEHRLMVPHRRSIGEIAGEGAELSWIDLDLGFETAEGSAGRLVARFVLDGAAGEWFLHRAVTVHDPERLAHGNRCQLIL
jgi:hypothetical protein